MLTDPGSVPKGNATEEHIERLQAAEEFKVAADYLSYFMNFSYLTY